MQKGKIGFDKRDFQKAIDTFKNMSESIDDKYIKKTLRRKSNPIISKMKQNSHSVNIAKMIGASTSKKNTRNGTGIKVGVVKNSVSLFPDFSAPALASVIEYGTEERFRKTTTLGGRIVTGRLSTGKVTPKPWLRKSWDEGVGQMMKEFEESIIKKIEKDTN